MKVLITGNMGYIGPVLIRHLRQAVPAVQPIGFDAGYFADRLLDAATLPDSAPDEQHMGDVRDVPERLLDGIDAIIQLAAVSNDPMGKEFEAATAAVNCAATVALAAAGKRAGARSFVFASSCSVYGFAEDGARTESSELNPLTAYARSKCEAEKRLSDLAGPGFNVTCLRFATACGISPRLRLDLVLNDFVATALRTGEIRVLSDGSPWRPLINVSDMARAMEWAICRPAQAGGAFVAVNAGSNQWNYQIRDLAEAVAAALPGTSIQINKDAQPDKRSYRVCFDRFADLAPDHQPAATLQSTIAGLREGLERAGARSPEFKPERLVRLKTLMELKSAGRLDSDLRWRPAEKPVLGVIQGKIALPARKPEPKVNPRADELRKQILDLTEQYYAAAFPERQFVPGESGISYAGRVFDEKELRTLVDSSLDFWLTTGRFAEQFEKRFARWFGLRDCALVNSGSSADLVAISALTSPRLRERRLQPGDEVISVAAGFPTTVNPILQNGLVPVFVDIRIGTYNVDVERLEAALSPRTRAVVLAHTLGNPFDVDAVVRFARKHSLWLVEDCCDAVGSTYKGQKVGTFGDLATVSFYPAHHITMGEGGAVLTDVPMLGSIVRSFRDWGRDCWCEPGCDNTCGKRFDWQLGDLPHGYDHKFTYSHIGYNLKLTDMQAAVGVAQLDKLEGFIESRKRNFARLHEGLREMEEFFVLPEATPGSDPSWFGFPIAVRPEAPFSRNDVTGYLEKAKVATRLLFGGNLTRQPAYKGANYRVAGSLENTDFAMDRVFWIGVYPGIKPDMLEYTLDVFRAFCGRQPGGVPGQRSYATV